MMQSPLKKPDNDDTPRDPSMLRSASARVSGMETSQNQLEEEMGYEEEDDIVVEKQEQPFAEEDPFIKTAPTAPTVSEGRSNAPSEDPANNNNNNSNSNNNNNNSSKPKNAKPPKRELNPDWKDLRETGEWGKQVSTKDIVIAVTIGLLVVVGVVVGVVLGIGNDDETSAPPAKATNPPTMSPTTISPEQELVYALNAIDYSDFTYIYQQDLPLTVEEYEGLMDDPTATPQERAMSWLLYQDDRDISHEAGERWALASLYYSWKGEEWTSAENWLSSEDACEWEHISCDLMTGDIQEINLESNNLVGTIPPEISMLNTTQSIWLRNNVLTGTLPNEVFGSMPRLSILYLDKNQLTGTISVVLRENGLLNSLFVQFNNLTGEWPRLFCPLPSSQSPGIMNFGLDCDEVACMETCCSAYNCYYDN